MNAFDEFNRLTKIRDSLARYRWTLANVSRQARLFYDDGRGGDRRTHEHEFSADELDVVNAAEAVVEHQAGSTISYCGSYALGDAVKAVVLRHLDSELRRLSKLGREQAEAVLATHASTK